MICENWAGSFHCSRTVNVQGNKYICKQDHAKPDDLYSLFYPFGFKIKQYIYEYIQKKFHNLNPRRRLGRRVRAHRSRGRDGGRRRTRTERRVRLQCRRRRSRLTSDRLRLYEHGDRGSGA